MLKHKNDIINKNQKIIKEKDLEIEKLKELCSHKENYMTSQERISTERNKNQDLFELFLHADPAEILQGKENKTPLLFEKKPLFNKNNIKSNKKRSLKFDTDAYKDFE